MNAATEPLIESRLESLQPGEQLGRYQLLCPIARGGMGQVWAARQIGPLGLPRLVAIKVALPQGAAAYDTAQKFLFDEARVAASIDHPNVCRILELGEERGILFIAMEWIYGVPLSTLVNAILPERRLDYVSAAYIVAQACSGLHAAHELRDDDGIPLEVVHRDATPQNLLISATGEIKVVDFGIVKSRNQVHQPTEAGEIKGKLSYLAPEQLRGKALDRRVDVFALGCVLYLATTGRRAFTGDDAGRIIARIMHGDYPAPHCVVPDYPDELGAIVARAMATDPNDRYRTAAEMQADLEQYLAKQGAVFGREQLATLLARYCGPAIEQRRGDIRAAQKLFDSQNGDNLRDARGYPASGTYSIAGHAPAMIAPPASATGNVTDLSSASSAELRTGSEVRKRVRYWPAALVSTLIALSAAALFATRVADEPSPPLDARPAATHSPEQPTKSLVVRKVAITVRSNRNDAVVSIDGGPPLTLPHTFEVPSDPAAHVLRVSAPGYSDVVRSVAFDADQTVVMELSTKQPAARARTLPGSRRISAGPSTETSAPAQPPVATTEAPKPFAPSLTRPAARHAIDETDPFRNP